VYASYPLGRIVCFIAARGVAWDIFSLGSCCTDFLVRCELVDAEGGIEGIEGIEERLYLNNFAQVHK
jgi:hypothetical protein